MKKKKVLFIAITLLAITLLATACSNEKEKKEQQKYDYLVLVNKYSRLPDDWEKNVELVNTKNAWDEDIQVEKEAYKQFKKFKQEVDNDLKEYNTTIELDSTYRSIKAQQELWDEWSEDPEKGIDYVRKFVAVPGYSEHHTGLAIDICLKKDGELVYDNDEMIAEREIFEKIHAKLSKYGFILRYLENREDMTGYTYEPWHLRYVGDTEIAKEIMDKNITFEEYLGGIDNIKENQSAAKYQIERALQEHFKEIYQDKITNSRFNVTKIYTEKEEKEKTMKSLKLGKNEVAFEVTYQLQPAEGIDLNELMVVDGEYDENLGWVKNLSRVGVLRYHDKNNSYSIDNFGTGW